MPEGVQIYLYTRIIMQFTVHMSRQGCWFDTLNLLKSHLAGKPCLYLLSPFSFSHGHAFISLSLCGSRRKSGARQRPAEYFQASSVFPPPFLFPVSLTLPFFVSWEKRMGGISSWKQKRLDIRERKGGQSEESQGERDSAVGYQGYWEAAD